MNKAILLILPIVLVIVVIAVIFLAPTPYRAVLMALPAVDNVSDECVFNNIIDVIEAYVNDTLFTAEEFLSLSCTSESKDYTAEIYLTLNPVDENRIEQLLNASEPVMNVSSIPIYRTSDSRLMAKHHSNLYFYTFGNFSEQEKTAAISDSLNSRNFYDLDEMFLFLDRIPDSTAVIDSVLYQKQVFFSDELKTALKGWYIGTTRLASQQGFVILREPEGIEKRCYDWDSEATPFGTYFKCFGNGTCGPKFLLLPTADDPDAEAYTMDADDMFFTCSSVEDAFTDGIMRNTR